ncbi:MAG TPA: hypothetical protein EYH31_11160 [Anaerolineae bacterium]|nr:hypothetical protein [Anaerolineae bacterium]
MEQQRLADSDRTRQLNEWADEIAAVKELVENFRVQFRTLMDGYQASERAVKSLQEFEERIQREQNQVAELQRLAEERQRRELGNFLEENDKRWRKQTLQWEHQQKEQTDATKALEARLPPLEEAISVQRELIAHLWKLQETYGMHQLQEAQRWLTTLEQALAERPKDGNV